MSVCSIRPLLCIVIAQVLAQPAVFKRTVRYCQMDSLCCSHTLAPPGFPSPSGVWLTVPTLQHHELTSTCLSRAVFSPEHLFMYLLMLQHPAGFVVAFRLQRCYLQWCLFVIKKNTFGIGHPFTLCHF